MALPASEKNVDLLKRFLFFIKIRLILESCRRAFMKRGKEEKERGKSETPRD